jgi:hypothetical protein
LEAADVELAWRARECHGLIVAERALQFQGGVAVYFRYPGAVERSRNAQCAAADDDFAIVLNRTAHESGRAIRAGRVPLLLTLGVLPKLPPFNVSPPPKPAIARLRPFNVAPSTGGHSSPLQTSRFCNKAGRVRTFPDCACRNDPPLVAASRQFPAAIFATPVTKVRTSPGPTGGCTPMEPVPVRGQELGCWTKVRNDHRGRGTVASLEGPVAGRSSRALALDQAARPPICTRSSNCSWAGTTIIRTVFASTIGIMASPVRVDQILGRTRRRCRCRGVARQRTGPRLSVRQVVAGEIAPVL